MQQIAKDCELAAITMGAQGAMAVHDGEIVTVPAYPGRRVVDATGAGDLFASGFLLALARGRDLRTALAGRVPRGVGSDLAYRRAADPRSASRWRASTGIAIC